MSELIDRRVTTTPLTSPTAAPAKPATWTTWKRWPGIAATVPGCVHTDLLAAGLIEDPWVGLAESAQHWIGACDWTYRTTLPPVPDADRTPRVPDDLVGGR